LIDDSLSPLLVGWGEMKRDMDLVRTLLLWIESDPHFDGTRQFQPNEPSDLGITDRSYADVAYNLNHLIKHGYVEGSHTAQMPFVAQLTWAGHDFLDSVRDPETWAKTKKAAAGAGGCTVDL
jgi:hypothetical protein